MEQTNVKKNDAHDDQLKVDSQWEALKYGLSNKHFCLGAAVAIFGSLILTAIICAANIDVLADLMYNASEMGIGLVVVLIMIAFALPQLIIYSRLGILGFPKVKSADDFRMEKNKAFYDRCVREGLKNADTPAGIAKLKQIAQVMGMSDSESELRAIFEAFDREATDAPLRKLRGEEAEEKAKLERFVSFTGREKRRRMILDVMPEEMKYMDAGSVFYQKESDWAIAGGIASGLAGGAAGVAAALDVQAKNAQIRANNAAMRSTVDAINKMQWGTVDRNNEQRRYLQQQLERIPMLLSEELQDPKAMMENIDIVHKLSVSKTGAVIVDLTMKLKENVKIMGEADAVLDGCINVVLTGRDGQRDVTPVSLPMFGLTCNAERVKALSTAFSDPNGQYCVSFEPRKLWLIER